MQAKIVADSSEPDTRGVPPSTCAKPGATTMTVPAMALKCMPQIATAMTMAATARCPAVRSVTASQSAAVDAASAIRIEAANHRGR